MTSCLREVIGALMEQSPRSEGELSLNTNLLSFVDEIEQAHLCTERDHIFFWGVNSKNIVTNIANLSIRKSRLPKCPGVFREFKICVLMFRAECFNTRGHSQPGGHQAPNNVSSRRYPKRGGSVLYFLTPVHNQGATLCPKEYKPLAKRGGGCACVNYVRLAW